MNDEQIIRLIGIAEANMNTCKEMGAAYKPGWMPAAWKPLLDFILDALSVPQGARRKPYLDHWRGEAFDGDVCMNDSDPSDAHKRYLAWVRAQLQHGEQSRWLAA